MDTPESNSPPAKEYVSRWASSLPQASSVHGSTERTSKTAQATADGGLESLPHVTNLPKETLSPKLSASISAVSSITTISKNSPPKEHHTVEEVATWLENLGYNDAALRARCEEVDGEAVVAFNVQDFRSLGLKWGIAKKLTTWIRKGGDHVGAVGFQPPQADSSLTLGAERTLYASQQMGWNIIFVGIGLMMANMDDEVPNICGMVSIIGGIAFIVASWLFHVKRLRDFSMHRGVSLVSSAVFTFGCTLLFMTAVSTELYFGAIYPYLMRTKQVEINN